MARLESRDVVGPLDGLHVLVVDDNRDARMIYKAVLGHWGAFVTAVASALAAARLLKHLRPDVMVTDLAMPGHDGVWLARWLRRREAKGGSRVPVIAITARDDIYERDSTVKVGLDDWLVKPVSHRDLIRAITTVASPAPSPRSA